MGKRNSSFHFSVSAFFLILTAFAVVCTIHTAGNQDEYVKEVVKVGWTASLVLTFAVAMGLPARRAILLSFLGGAILFRLCGPGPYDMFPNDTLGWIWNLTWESQNLSRGEFIEVVSIELSILVGLFSAGITHFIQVRSVRSKVTQSALP